MSQSRDIYLDYAAATPVDDAVLQAMLTYMTDKFYNPSAAYSLAIDVRRDYEDAKATIAQLLGAKKDQLTMTAGATESINLAFSAASDGHVVTSKIEHQAVLSTAGNYDHTIVGVGKTGRIKLDQLEQAITDQTSLVSIGLVNSELGTMQPMSNIANIINQIRQDRLRRGIKRPLYLHSDASQAGAYYDVKINRLGVDLLTLSAAKLYGPKQVALLYAASDVRLQPIVSGGGQEMGLRSGTENVAGVIGFAKAYQLADKRRASEVKRLSGLMQNFQSQLRAAIADMQIASDGKHHIVSICSLIFPGVDGERLMFGLEQDGVFVATGSACAANLGVRSHVLTATGLSPNEVDGSLRISMGAQTTEQDLGRAAQAIIQRVQHEKQRGKA